MKERYEWHDDSPPFPVEVLYFEPFSSSHGRITTTCWIPHDEIYCPDVYKIIITQIKWIRTTIDSPSLTIKRSREGANALHLSSTILSDLHAALDIITELVNFRIRSAEFKLKREPKTKCVDLFTINKYTGSNIVGQKSEEGKNFVVSLSEIFKIKTVVTFLNASTTRVAMLGKPADIEKARKYFELFIANMGEHTGPVDLHVEHEEQQKTLQLALESTNAPASPPAAPVGDTTTEDDASATVSTIMQRLPINVVKECEIETKDDVNVAADESEEDDNFEKPATHATAPTHHFPLFYPPSNFGAAQNMLNDPVFLNTFSHVFANTFVSSFTAACRQSTQVMNYYNVTQHQQQHQNGAVVAPAPAPAPPVASPAPL